MVVLNKVSVSLRLQDTSSTYLRGLESIHGTYFGLFGVSGLGGNNDDFGGSVAACGLGCTASLDEALRL